MEKTTVYLTADQRKALAAAAAEQGRSEARLIRDGIDAVTARHRTGEAVAPYATAPVNASAPAASWPPQWIGREEFVARFAGARADAGLATDLRALADEATDAAGDDAPAGAKAPAGEGAGAGADE